MTHPVDPNHPLVSEFMRGSSILIADLSPSTRPVIRRLMSTLGARTTQVEVAEDFESAIRHIETARPTIVFADYKLGRRPGMDLYAAFVKAVPDRLKTLFLIVANDTSPHAVSESIEAGIDGLIMRPMTPNDLQQKFLEVLSPKLEPTPYLKLVEAARRFLAAGKIEHANLALAEAQRKERAPVAALHLEGQVRMSQGDLIGALNAFERGLALDPGHYLCRVGMFEAHLATKRYREAYASGLAISERYPVLPRRIPELIRLCILTEQYSEVLRFYDSVARFEDADEALLRYVSAGLVICGKHLIARGDSENGVKTLRKAEVISKSRPGVIKEILIALYGAGLLEAAEEIRRRSAPEVASSDEVQLAVLEQMHASGPDAKTFLFAQELIGKGVKAVRLFEIAISQAQGLKRPADTVEQLVFKAGAAFPDQRERFTGLKAA